MQAARITRAAFEVESLSPAAISAANHAALLRDDDRDARMPVGLASSRAPTAATS